jgi:hypothetical protein
MNSHDNGYAFDEKHLMDNPFALPRLFSTKQFGNHWFDSGSSPSHEKQLASRHILPSEYMQMDVPCHAVVSSLEVEDVAQVLFLYHSGYLTLHEPVITDFCMLIPQNEKVTNNCFVCLQGISLPKEMMIDMPCSY